LKIVGKTEIGIGDAQSLVFFPGFILTRFRKTLHSTLLNNSSGWEPKWKKDDKWKWIDAGGNGELLLNECFRKIQQFQN